MVGYSIKSGEDLNCGESIRRPLPELEKVVSERLLLNSGDVACDEVARTKAGVRRSCGVMVCRSYVCMVTVHCESLAKNW